MKITRAKFHVVFSQKIGKFLFLVFLVQLLTGCVWLRETIWDWSDVPVTTTRSTPEEIYSSAERYYQEGLYKKATEEYQKIKELYPLSGAIVTIAELGVVDSLYARKEFVESLIAYTDFINIHPTNDKNPYCMYQVGMCYYEQKKSIDRDQTETIKAKQEFEKLIARFPGSHHAFLAEEKLRECTKRLAERELYIAAYYMRAEQYDSAVSRLETLLKKYPYADWELSVAHILKEAKASAFEAKRPLLNNFVMYGSKDGSYERTETDERIIAKIIKAMGDADNAYKKVINMAFDDYKSGRYTDAMHHTNLAWLINKDNYRHYYIFGLLTGLMVDNATTDNKTEMIDTALYCFEQALKHNPQHALSMANLGGYYREKVVEAVTQGRYATKKDMIDTWANRAGELLTKAQTLTTEPRELGLINYQLAKFLSMLGKFDDAWQKIEMVKKYRCEDIIEDAFIGGLKDNLSKQEKK